MTKNSDDYWKIFANGANHMGSALYGRLALIVDGDERLRALAARAIPEQPQANVLFGAVHFLLMRGARHPLRDFYPTLGGTRSAADDDLAAQFRDFVGAFGSELDALVSTRVTNTNEVGRCAVLRPAFQALGREIDQPLHCIEVGPSAGLNLVWDRYGVRYRRARKIVAEILPDARLVVECELKGDRNPPLGTPPVMGSRLGLELNPVDLTDPGDRDWLRALMWPDQPERLARLDRAIALFLDEKPVIRVGDALELLPSVIAALPPGPVCVYHTYVLFQFSEPMKKRMADVLIEAGRSRPVHRLSHEFDGSGHWLEFFRYEAGGQQVRRLASAHPHGTWLEWQA